MNGNALTMRKLTKLRLLKLMNIILMALPYFIAWRMSFTQVLSLSGAVGVAATLVFLVLYVLFVRVYGAFFISQSRISELVTSQILSALFADFFCYLLLSVVLGRFPGLWPKGLILPFQMMVALAWTYWIHQWYFRTFPPERSAVIYDDPTAAERLLNDTAMKRRYHAEVVLPASECDAELHCLDGVEVIFLADVNAAFRDAALRYGLERRVPVYVVPSLGDIIMSGAARIHMFHDPVLRAARYLPRPEYAFGKRVFDLVVSCAALVVLLPILLLSALAVKLCDGGPVLYRQTRLTKNGKTFQLLKFRSMRVDAESDGVARLSTGANDKRVTAVGRVLRKYRIDELPQLLNIIRGDLSIVGPRPERPEIAAEYEKTLPEFRLRLQTKAGLTGYAQVYGRYNTDPYHKLQMDLMYIAQSGFLEDLRICFATVKTLFMPESTEGVQEGMTTAMEEERETIGV